MDSKSIKRVLLDHKLLSQMNIKHDIIDTHNVECYIDGPEHTPYEKGSWKIAIQFPYKYPFKSPSVAFIDKIYHPNVDYNSGSICLNVLNEEWQPIYTIEHILNTFIPQLMTYPNPDDPLNPEAAVLYINNQEQFNRHVKMLIFKQNEKIQTAV